MLCSVFFFQCEEEKPSGRPKLVDGTNTDVTTPTIYCKEGETAAKDGCTELPTVTPTISLNSSNSNLKAFPLAIPLDKPIFLPGVAPTSGGASIQVDLDFSLISTTDSSSNTSISNAAGKSSTTTTSGNLGNTTVEEIPLDSWLSYGSESDCITSYTHAQITSRFDDSIYQENLSNHSKLEQQYNNFPITPKGEQSLLLENTKNHLSDFYNLKDRLKLFINNLKCLLSYVPISNAIITSTNTSGEYDYSTDFKNAVEQKLAVTNTTNNTFSLIKTEDNTSSNDSDTGTSTTNDTSTTSGTEGTSSTDPSLSVSDSNISVNVKRAVLRKEKPIKMGKSSLNADRYTNKLYFDLRFPEGTISFQLNSIVSTTKNKAKGDGTIIIEAGANSSTRHMIGYSYYIKKLSKKHEVALEITHIPNAGSLVQNDVDVFKQKILTGKTAIFGNKTYIHKYLNRYVSSNNRGDFGKYEALYIDQSSRSVKNPILSFDGLGTCSSMQMYYKPSSTQTRSTFSVPKRECFSTSGSITRALHDGALAHLIPNLDHINNLEHILLADENPDNDGLYYFDLNGSPVTTSITQREDENCDYSPMYNITEEIEYDACNLAPPTAAPDYTLPDFFHSDINGQYWTTYCSERNSDPFLCAAVQKESLENSVD